MEENGGSATGATNTTIGDTAGSGGIGGTGGIGLIINGSSSTNSGQIAGGTGGGAVGGFSNAVASVGGQGGSGGAGGSAVSITANGITFGNTGTLFGGAGGAGDGGAGNNTGSAGGNAGNGGIGGDGIDSIGNSIVLTNSGSVAGGAGGSATGGSATGTSAVAGNGGTGSAGGTGYNISGIGATLTNNGVIFGGAGGAGNGGTGNGTGSAGGNAGNGGIGGDGIDSIGNSILLTNSNTVTGGAGGSATGGADTGSTSLAGNGGTGSAGGAGYNISGTGTTLTNNGDIIGGAGGSASGGTASGSFSSGGNGGTGGTGGAGITISVSGITITNNNTITGGNGGMAGRGTGFVNGSNGTAGSGGAGISFSAGSGTVINSGTITGGIANGGTGAQADAIDFAGGNNQLQLLSTSTITGNVVVQSPTSNNALVLTGSTNGTFDASKIGTQYLGFDTYLKTGTSTWSLANTTTAVTSWNVTGGTLQISSDANLGNASGSLTLNGGTLATTASFATNRTITLGASGGSFAPAASTQFTVGSVLTGSNALTEKGAGTLILSANNTYSGGTTISSGTLQIGAGGTTGSIVGNVTDNSTLAFNRSDSITFGGVISGTGTLTQQGAGSLTLSGANTYSGGTVLQNGTLILGNSKALGSGALTSVDPTVVYTNGIAINNSVILNGLTTLEVDNSDSATQSGVISGTSGINKVGTGSLTLSGSNTFSGGTTLSAGTLVIANPNGLGNGAVTVSGGTLMTDGGNHLITVNGNYTQTTGTLALSLYSATVFDQIAVSGQATLGGTLALNFQNGLAPGSGQSFILVKTNQAVVGQFGTVTSNLPSIGATITYSNNATLVGNTTTTTTTTSPSGPVLVLTQKAFGDLYGNYLSSNQHGAASYIDAQDQVIKNASFGNLVSALNQISPSENGLRAAFDELSPLKFHSFASSTAFNNTPFLIQQFDDYLSSHRSENGGFVASNGGIDDSGLVINDPTIDPGLQTVHSRLMAFNTGAGTPAADGKDLKNVITPERDVNRWNAFATGNVILGQDFSVSQSGLSHSDITSENVQIGADYRLSPNWLAGVTFGYGHSGANLDSIGSAAYVDTYSPGLYAAYSKENWYANSLFNYGFNNYTQHRNVQIGSFDGTASSKPKGNQIVLNSDGGYDFHHGGWTFGPTAGLDYVHLDINNYSESGLPGADLNVKEDQSDSLRSLLGGHVSYRFTGEGVTFTSHLNASWQHEFFDAGRNITSQFNDIAPAPSPQEPANPSRDSALIDAGLDAQITKAISLFTNYTVQAGQENYFGQSVQAGVKVNF